MALVETAASSIFISVGFEPPQPEKLGGTPPKRFKIVPEEDTADSPRRFEDEESAEDRKLEKLSLILKLWLRRIHLPSQDRRVSFQDLEYEIYKTQEEIIKPYKRLLISNKFKCPEILLMSQIYNKRLRDACDKLKEEAQRVNFEIPEEDLSRLRRKEVFVCSLLGLKLDFLDRLEDTNPERRSHWTLEDWIVAFIRNNYEFISSQEKASISKDLLISIGFDPLSSAVETIMSRAENMQHHIEACEWAEIFIADEFKSNPLLSPQAAIFPFQSDLRNTWFQLSSVPDENNESNNDPRHVNVMNVVIRESCASQITRTLLNDFAQPNGQNVVLYHGTDHQSAADIFDRGIYLSAGREKRDFSSGKGFYLTNDFNEAFNWARSTTSKPAILVFQANREHLSNARKLNLNNDEERWRKMVSIFRSDEETAETRKSLVKSYDLIEGPMATVQLSESGELVLERKASSHQICLISDRFAEEFEQTLQSLLFLDVYA